MLTINNTLDGYLKDVEIKGNTIQDTSNLADIRSVGDKVEGQELYEIPVLSCGKNLLDNTKFTEGVSINASNGLTASYTNYGISDFIRVFEGNTYTISKDISSLQYVYFYKDVALSTENYLGISNRIEVASNTKSKQFNVPSGAKYCVISSTNETRNIQLEEGNQATPYEPYVEDKITILSPVQLEKIGDVADRVIEKDGVWGVEKNVETIKFTGNEEYTTDYPNSTYFSIKCKNLFNIVDINNDTVCIINSDKYLNRTGWTESSFSKGNVCIFNSVNTSGYFQLTFMRQSGFDSLSSCVNYVKNNNFEVKVPLKQPQFIPLPQSQQVKLRTFANKTNISFGCEIEGTMKAQVPKSLGATVNTHTEQISNLNKELDRVKKLEESTVSTVTTESDFTVVEQTSNGYFEDVKLEGKTLVNLVTNPSIKTVNFKTNNQGVNISCIKNEKYTLSFNVTSNTLDGKLKIRINTNPSTYVIVDNIGFTGVFRTVVNLAENTNYITFYDDTSTTGSATVSDIMLLEGDHTQNPPSYFEGLKSVGDGADEIVVSSCGKNLLDEMDIIIGSLSESTGQPSSGTHSVTNNYIRIKPNTRYIMSTSGIINGRFYFYDKQYNFISTALSADGGVISPSNAYYIKLRMPSAGYYNTQLEEGTVATPYEPYQSDKKRLLFYNEETQAWEKPILREWDSIEKHSDGKYYYHKRSEECVLDGSVGTFNVSVIENNDYIRWYRATNTIIPKAKVGGRIICDTLNNETYAKLESRTCEGIGIKNQTPTDLGVTVLKSRYSATTNTELNSQLASKPITFIYEINEEVYECTNIDLITYANETNYIVESGAISPKSALKVHNNISNVVSLLQKKVSLLEGNITSYMITQNRMQLASTYSADSVTFKVDYALCSEEAEYNEDLYNLILNNILVGKDNYDYNKMFTMILDYASWNQISWEQFDILVGLMDMQNNPPVEEVPSEDETLVE